MFFFSKIYILDFFLVTLYTSQSHLSFVLKLSSPILRFSFYVLKRSSPQVFGGKETSELFHLNFFCTLEFEFCLIE